MILIRMIVIIINSNDNNNFNNNDNNNDKYCKNCQESSRLSTSFIGDSVFIILL